MEQAGYPNGVDRETGRALSLNYEAVATGPDDRARLNWIRKQFAKLGIELVIRSTDYNRFQEKVRNGTGQVFMSRLERRLSRSRELPVPALWPATARSSTRARTRLELPEPRVRPPVRRA
jgi:ABC-type transport system substrate-binding protein